VLIDMNSPVDDMRTHSIGQDDQLNRRNIATSSSRRIRHNATVHVRSAHFVGWGIYGLALASLEDDERREFLGVLYDKILNKPSNNV
jgi:hypothetical protein